MKVLDKSRQQQEEKLKKEREFHDKEDIKLLAREAARKVEEEKAAKNIQKIIRGKIARDTAKQQQELNKQISEYKQKQKEKQNARQQRQQRQQEQNAAKNLQAAIRRKPIRDFLVYDLPIEREHNNKQKEYAELLQKQKKENEEKLKLGIVRYNQQYKMDSIKWIN